MSFFTDQLGRTIALPSVPQRIVSLVPSQTELLFDLGLDQQVVGITKFCVHPDHWFRHKTRIGGTKTLHIDRIHALQPDLVIANKEENVKEQVEQLAEHYPVWISDIHNLDSALDMMQRVGDITGTAAKAATIVQQVRQGFSSLSSLSLPVNTAYLIWKDPWMTIGGDTFIHDMLTRCGLQNVFGGTTRYPEISLERLRGATSATDHTSAAAQCILLSSEPFPFQQKHIDALQQEFPGTTILLVDGEMFSWYGSRLLHAPGYFGELLKKLQ